MTDLIIIAVVLAIVAAAGLYIYKSKKSGVKCIGCPHSANCSAGKAGACSGCGQN